MRADFDSFSTKAFWLVTLLAIWSLGLLMTLNMDVRERRTRLLSENHVLETVAFYVRERQALPLQTALEALRAESGYTRLSLCHRGRLVLSAGESGAHCQPESSALIETWQSGLPTAPGYQLVAETRIVTLLSSLCFLILGVSLATGLFYVLQAWRKSSPLSRVPHAVRSAK